MLPSDLAAAVAEYLGERVADSPIPTAIVSREFLPVYTPAKLLTCRVPVAPVQTGARSQSRGASNRERVIQIAPHLKANVSGDEFDAAQIELFLTFVSWLDETLETRGKIAGHTWESSETVPLYDVAALHDDQVLRSTLSITYRTLVRV